MSCTNKWSPASKADMFSLRRKRRQTTTAAAPDAASSITNIRRPKKKELMSHTEKRGKMS